VDDYHVVREAKEGTGGRGKRSQELGLPLLRTRKNVVTQKKEKKKANLTVKKRPDRI